MERWAVCGNHKGSQSPLIRNNGALFPALGASLKARGECLSTWLERWRARGLGGARENRSRGLQGGTQPACRDCTGRAPGSQCSRVTPLLPFPPIRPARWLHPAGGQGSGESCPTGAERQAVWRATFGHDTRGQSDSSPVRGALCSGHAGQGSPVLSLHRCPFNHVCCFLLGSPASGGVQDWSGVWRENQINKK